MWNEPTQERLNSIPKLYETEHVPLKEKMVHLKFFIGDCAWFIVEYDGEDLFWGFCHLGNDDFAEWGYISFTELKELNIHCFEVDCELEAYFPVRRAAEVEKICKAHGWLFPSYGNEDHYDPKGFMTMRKNLPLKESFSK
jgi:hypothetical protein